MTSDTAMIFSSMSLKEGENLTQPLPRERVRVPITPRLS